MPPRPRRTLMCRTALRGHRARAPGLRADLVRLPRGPAPRRRPRSQPARHRAPDPAFGLRNPVTTQLLDRCPAGFGHRLRAVTGAHRRSAGGSLAHPAARGQRSHRRGAGADDPARHRGGPGGRPVQSDGPHRHPAREQGCRAGPPPGRADRRRGGAGSPAHPVQQGGRGTGRRRPGRLRLERGDRGPVPADRGGLLVPAGAAGAGGGVRRQASRPAAITAAV